MINYSETPVQEIKDSLLDKAQVRLLLKREDLNHPLVNGNKWWKLKYNLEEARRLGKKKILTFGGAYSNHIYATSAAAAEAGFECIGIIRGEETFPLNPTLTFAKSQGMRLQYVARDEYRKKTETEFIDALRKNSGDFYLIPEGGTNALAVKGCEEFANKILAEANFDSLFLPVGTGGTIAGFINSFNGNKVLNGVAVLKNGEFLIGEIKQWVSSPHNTWTLLTDYHHGGYAKTTKELMAFMKQFVSEKEIPLEPVYTGKLMWAIFEEIKMGNVKKGSTILAVHTGGLQGGSDNYPNKF